MVVFGAAGSVPKTSRAFVVVVLGFFCCRFERELRKESILFRCKRFGCAAVCSAPLAAPGLAAIGYARLRRVIISPFILRLAACCNECGR